MKLPTNIIPLLALLIIILQNPIWPFWFIGRMGSFALILVLLLIFVLEKRIRLTTNQFLLLCLSFLTLVIIPLFNGVFHASSIFSFICLVLVLGMKASEKYIIFDKLTTYLSIIISVSLPAWLIHQYIYPLPIYSLIDIASFKGIDDGFMENYILFVQAQGVEAIRFYSMFDEPGVLGTLSAFVLYGNNYNLKDRRNIIILIGAFFTFSLAFILLSIFGIIWHSRRSIKTLLRYIFCISISVYMLFVFLLSENLAFQQSVAYRMANLFEPEALSRNSISFDYYYDKLVNSPMVLIGYGGKINDYVLDGASYKNFIFEYGILGIFGLFFIYILIIKIRNLDNFGCLLMFSLSFLQRPVAFTAWQILLFACITCVVGVRTTQVGRKRIL